MQTPTIGRIVHFRLDEGRSRGEWRPAIIVRVWGEQPSSAVQLQVFTDAANDGLDPVVWKTSRLQGENVGQWRWPPYVPATAELEGAITTRGGTPEEERRDLDVVRRAASLDELAQ